MNLSTWSKTKFLASSGDLNGYMFKETGNDTGMGSDEDGVLYFSQNGTKFYLNNMFRFYEHNPSSTPVNLDDCFVTAIYRFAGSVNIINGPISKMTDMSMLVVGPTHGFKMIVASDCIYFQLMKWDGSLTLWKKINLISV